ncbi:putative phosphoribosylaminoimidazole-succinocarboxamide synthase [Pseudovirgaria hyperparasitica]|uniref:Phosphoribosylaminoimidazole-succinocarboxamide synthase n=1 Tax=Pseudovirgaria hyperparasitica TaxID=470096 RepID=A0A6A6W6W3_9PEZI|nr:putative phosphoribosylaminoimidazole-succinocarboxamide synthase [Pseudovirgaria hyperparasitica]KAF2757307.1 putative phosphoribosylaminoimidazole-succinocarboxamide synthase [Pseudovirgaria hyperparasitica]
MASNVPLVEIDLQGSLKRVASGKVRDLFEIDEHTLLFVASDRISAYDVIMRNGIPQKGALLTQMSSFWFSYLSRVEPSLQTHFLASDLPAAVTYKLSPDSVAMLSKRSMQVRRLKPFALESIVRGYITGSAWSEYKSRGTVHGIKVSGPGGAILREGDKFDKPIWTPSTKAELGDKDENIHPDQAKDIVGAEYAKAIEELSLALYTAAHEYALTKGIIIADTKFEFAAAPETSSAEPKIVLIDEVLTPDSSRFWPLSEYKPGGAQPSFDKQFLRDWLTSEGLKGKESVTMPDHVVRQTGEKYQEAFVKLTAE